MVVRPLFVLVHVDISIPRPHACGLADGKNTPLCYTAKNNSVNVVTKSLLANAHKS